MLPAAALPSSLVKSFVKERYVPLDEMLVRTTGVLAPATTSSWSVEAVPQAMPSNSGPLSSPRPTSLIASTMDTSLCFRSLFLT